MKLFYTSVFKKDFQRLPKEIQVLAEKKLALFLSNFRHPSLAVKKMGGLEDIWEGRVTDNYRFTFKTEGNLYILRRIGVHDIARKEK